MGAGAVCLILLLTWGCLAVYYVVGDERDIVGSRIGHRNEQVYLYRLRTTPEATRRLFDVYLKRINLLAAHPEFYHLLSNSCTINIARFAHEAGRGSGTAFTS